MWNFIVLGILFPLLGSSIPWNDTLYDVMKLTTHGDHSHPRFSADGRWIYYTAKGQPYGSTDCSHVYRMDRAYPPLPVSLISTGIGMEEEVGVYNGSNAIKWFISSTAPSLFGKISTPEFKNSESFCPQSKCVTPTDEGTRRSCIYAHVERYEGTSQLMSTASGVILATFGDPNSVNQWINKPSKQTFNDGSIGIVNSQRCPNGECAQKSSQSSSNTYSDGNSWLDGFEFDITGGTINAEMPVYYHGAKFADQQLMSAAMNGVIPIVQAKVFKAKFSDIQKNQWTADVVNLGGDPTDSFIYPSLGADEGNAVVTRVTANGDLSLVAIQDGKVSVITDESVNSFHGAISPDGLFVTFISNRDGDGDQLYVAALQPNIETPPFERLPPVPFEPPSEYLVNATSFHNANFGELGPVFRPRYSRSGTALIFTARHSSDVENSCPQVYEIDLNVEDITAVRKMSTGVHYFSSPVFIGPEIRGDILYAAAFTSDGFERTTTGLNTQSRCRSKCSNPATAELKELCSTVRIEYPLPPESELYVANQFGTIMARLTTDNVFDGEVAISPNREWIIFSHDTGEDYELFKMPLMGGTKDAVRLTFAKGFEGSVEYCPNSNWILYSAYRIKNATEKQRYMQMRAHGFTDIGRTDIFLMNLFTKVEYRLTTDSDAHYHSATFSHDAASIFYVRTDLNTKISTLVQIDHYWTENARIYKELSYCNQSLSDLTFSPYGKTAFVYGNGSLAVSDFDNALWLERNPSNPKNPPPLSTEPPASHIPPSNVTNEQTQSAGDVQPPLNASDPHPPLTNANAASQLPSNAQAANSASMHGSVDGPANVSSSNPSNPPPNTVGTPQANTNSNMSSHPGSVTNVNESNSLTSISLSNAAVQQPNVTASNVTTNSTAAAFAYPSNIPLASILGSVLILFQLV